MRRYRRQDRRAGGVRIELMENVQRLLADEGSRQRHRVLWSCNYKRRQKRLSQFGELPVESRKNNGTLTHRSNAHQCQKGLKQLESGQSTGHCIKLFDSHRPLYSSE